MANYYRFFICLFVLLLSTLNLQAAEQINGRLDVLGAVAAGRAVLTSSAVEGEPGVCFNGSTHDVLRTSEVNPAFVQVAFTTAKAVTRLKVYANTPGDYNLWRVEAADTQTDLDSQSSSYRLVVPEQYFTDSGEVTLATAVSKKIWKFTVQRFADDICINFREFELWGNVNIDTLELTPAAPRVFLNDTGSLAVQGHNNTLDENYLLLPETVTWSSSNTGVVSVPAPGQTLGVSAGTAALTASYRTISRSVTATTYGLTGAPAGFGVTGFYTTAKLAWNKLTGPDVAGYAIYRRPAQESYGPLPVGRIANDSLKTVLVYNDYGLAAGANYYYKLAAFNAKGSIISQYTTELSVTLSSSPASYSKTAAHKLLVVAYTPGMADITRTTNSIYKGLEFFYRNALGKLNLDPTFMYIDEPCPSTAGGTTSGIEADLRARGIYDDQYDEFFIMATNLCGWLGGFCMLGNTWGSIGYADDEGAISPYRKDALAGLLYPGQIWIFTHEFQHAVQYLSIYSQDLYMMGCHPNENYPLPAAEPPYEFNCGGGWDINAETLRTFRFYDQYTAPHDDYIEYLDTDHDGLADNDTRLPVDEARFNSSPSLADTDADGLADLGEYTAGIAAGTNPCLADTDGDGQADGSDPTPTCDFSPVLTGFSTPPPINGTIDASWTRLGSLPAYQLDPAVQATFYGGWDDNYIYVGVKSNQKIRVWMQLDGSGENGRWVTNGIFAGYTDWEAVAHTAEAHGDSYDGDDKTLYIDPDLSQVSLGFNPINLLNDSQVALSGSGTDWTLTCRIPKDLGPGSGLAYWTPGTPVVTGVGLNQGRVLGLQFIYAPAALSGEKPYECEYWSTLAEPDCYYTCVLTQNSGNTDVTVRYRCGDPAQPGDNHIKPHFIIVNNGPAAIPLSELTLRYWYTIDGAAGQQFWVDYAARGNQSVNGRFAAITPRPQADYYLEVGFTGEAGTLYPGSDSGEIQVRCNKENWGNYSETADYSCDASKTEYTTWNRVTLYRNGTLIYGLEP